MKQYVTPNISVRSLLVDDVIRTSQEEKQSNISDWFTD